MPRRSDQGIYYGEETLFLPFRWKGATTFLESNSLPRGALCVRRASSLRFQRRDLSTGNLRRQTGDDPRLLS